VDVDPRARNDTSTEHGGMMKRKRSHISIAIATLVLISLCAVMIARDCCVLFGASDSGDYCLRQTLGKTI